MLSTPAAVPWRSGCSSRWGRSAENHGVLRQSAWTRNFVGDMKRARPSFTAPRIWFKFQIWGVYSGAEARYTCRSCRSSAALRTCGCSPEEAESLDTRCATLCGTSASTEGATAGIAAYGDWFVGSRDDGSFPRICRPGGQLDRPDGPGSTHIGEQGQCRVHGAD